MGKLQQTASNIFNLSNYEARVYISLCAFERANISQISRAANIPRTAIYPALNSLLDKGFVSIVLVGKRKHYRPLSPDQLSAVFERKKSDLNFLIQELSSKVPTATEPLEMLYFPGKNGINSAAEVFLAESKGKIWRTFESSVINHPSIDFYQFEDYINRRVKKGIHGRVIASTNIVYPWLKERIDKNKEELRDILLVPGKIFPFRVIIGINEDRILILSGEDVVFGAVIKNVQIAQTLAIIHDMIWSKYKQ